MPKFESNNHRFYTLKSAKVHYAYTNRDGHTATTLCGHVVPLAQSQVVKENADCLYCRTAFNNLNAVGEVENWVA
jgi:hypothetical protein